MDCRIFCYWWRRYSIREILSNCRVVLSHLTVVSIKKYKTEIYKYKRNKKFCIPCVKCIYFSQIALLIDAKRSLTIKISYLPHIKIFRKFTTICRTAFACWILANIFLQSVSRYVAYLTGLIGGLQLLTCLVWVCVHNPIPLVIPFEDGVIKMALGLHFWMTFGCGN